MLALTTFAQKDVTKFLGIPVDGTKAQMIAKLKAKGFTPSTKPYKKGALTGTFTAEKLTYTLSPTTRRFIASWSQTKMKLTSLR